MRTDHGLDILQPEREPETIGKHSTFYGYLYADRLKLSEQLAVNRALRAIVEFGEPETTEHEPRHAAPDVPPGPGRR